MLFMYNVLLKNLDFSACILDLAIFSSTFFCASPQTCNIFGVKYVPEGHMDRKQ